MSGTEATASHARRTTALLGALLVLLIVALCAVSYFFVRILLPAGAPEPVVEQGGGLTWVRSIYGFGPSRDEQLLGPTDVAVAPNGRIHVTDPQRARVLTFNPDGTFAGIIHTGAGGTGRGQLGRPGSIACDADGNVYIADELNGKIIVFDKRARFVREWPVPGIANVDIAGDTLYARAGGEVVAFTFDGVERFRIGQRGRGPGAVLEPVGGITADDERIYVADALNQCIKAFDREGSLAWVLPSSAVTTSGAPAPGIPQSRPATDAIDLPQGLVLDRAGNLVVVDAFSFKIVRIDSGTGEALASFGRDGRKDGTFMYPSGIAYDAHRDWFVIADTANDRVQIVHLPGSGGGVPQAIRRGLSSPFRACGIPLLALIGALAVIALTRRRTAPSGVTHTQQD